MKKTDFSLDEWNFLNKFWSIQEPHTASEPLWIVAGTLHEFHDFVIKKRTMGLHFDYRFVYGPDVLRGLSRIRGFYIGTYKDREDWDQIENVIKIIKSKGG